MHFADSLTAHARKTSPLSIGIDPVMEKLPASLPRTMDGVRQFAKGILNAITGIAPVIKFQLACFEALGWEGMKLFWELAALAKERGFLIIADGKRGDIPATAALYAAAYLGKDSPVDALTVNPYLGEDSIRPFIDCCMRNDRGIFILVKTSNPGSRDLQDLPVGSIPLCERLAALVQRWGAPLCGRQSHLSCIGAVIGATYPEKLKGLRSIMPNNPFLIPGFGAQGGTAAGVRYGFLPNGTGAIVHATRSVIYASTGKDWQEKAREAAERAARYFTSHRVPAASGSGKSTQL